MTAMKMQVQKKLEVGKYFYLRLAHELQCAITWKLKFNIHS